MSGEEEALERFKAFTAQLDREELAIYLHTLDWVGKAKSNSAASRYMNSFGDWYRKRRGLQPRTPKRGAAKP